MHHASPQHGILKRSLFQRGKYKILKSNLLNLLQCCNYSSKLPVHVCDCPEVSPLPHQMLIPGQLINAGCTVEGMSAEEVKVVVQQVPT